MAAPIILALALAACAQPGEGPASADDFPTVTCTLAHRPNVEVAPQTDDTTLEPGDHQLLGFDEASIELDYAFDEGEGASFQIDGMPRDSEEVFVHHLYQFVPGEPPESAFAGGHGFTGLIYVTPPGTTAEVQVSCAAEPLG